jgi:hypothetical protein
MTTTNPHHFRNNLAGKKSGEAKSATMTPQESTKVGDTNTDHQHRPPDSTTTMMSILQRR